MNENNMINFRNAKFFAELGETKVRINATSLQIDISQEYPSHFIKLEGYFELSNNIDNGIKQVIFNPPATVVIWNDGTRTIVKSQEGDTYSKELGLAMAISKKYFGNKSNFNDIFKKWT